MEGSNVWLSGGSYQPVAIHIRLVQHIILGTASIARGAVSVDEWYIPAVGISYQLKRHLSSAGYTYQMVNDTRQPKGSISPQGSAPMKLECTNHLRGGTYQLG